MGKKAKKKPAEEVNLFNKTDLQRVGLFKELGYVTINDRYNSVGHGDYYNILIILNLDSCFMSYGYEKNPVDIHSPCTPSATLGRLSDDKYDYEAATNHN